MGARDWRIEPYDQGDLDCDEAIDRAWLHDTSPRKTGGRCPECGTELIEGEWRYCGAYCEGIARDSGRLSSVSEWPDE